MEPSTIKEANPSAALREQKRFKGPVEQLWNNDVAIFEGSCAGPGNGIVHRSPPIAGTPVERVAPVFALDQVPAVSQQKDGAAVTAVPNEFPELAVGDEAVCEAMIAD